MLGDFIHKKPELMAESELDLIIGTISFGSRLLERTWEASKEAARSALKAKPVHAEEVELQRGQNGAS
jgi:hypothetical protein